MQGRGWAVRTLNIIPIVHTPADLGNLADIADTVKRKIMPVETIQSSASAVRKFWEGLRDGLLHWDINFGSMKLYQDALPYIEAEHSGIEKMIVKELASKGSQNHQILQWLMDQGAQLIGTESPQLLVQEYQLMKETLETQSLHDNAAEMPCEVLARQAEILEQRDRFIAARISQTLDSESIGLIFLGMTHSLETSLSVEIDVCYPFGRPNVTKTGCL